jgi:hypothetical protein
MIFSPALALLMMGATSAQAQCRPADANGAGFVLMVKLYAIPRDSVWAEARDSLRIATPDPKIGVVQVTKAAVCKAANAAYQKVATGDRATLSGQVYVVQSGNTYVVWDPAYKYARGSGASYMVFDANWAFRKGFL